VACERCLNGDSAQSNDGTTTADATNGNASGQSNDQSQNVGDGTNTGGGGTGGGGGRTVVKVTPFGKLSYRRVQAVRKLYVTARSTEAGTLRASATVKVPGRRRAYRFKSVSRKVGANRSVKLRLKLSKKRLRAVRRALRKGKRLRVRVKVTARTVAGAARSQKATIRLKR